MIKLHFYKAPGDVEDKLIRLWQSFPRKTSGAKYSHVEIEIDNVTFSADANLGRVVSVISKSHPPHAWDTIDLPCKDAREAMAFCRAQVGKGYDYIGIFTAQILALRFDDPKRWFCSELAAHVCKVCGIPLKHYDSWYNPRRLWDSVVQFQRYNKISKYKG